MIKRVKGICAVLLLIGASGAGVGVALAVGTAAASGDAGGWRAAVQHSAWPGHAGQTNSASAHTSQPTTSSQPTDTGLPSGQTGPGQSGGRHGRASGGWDGNGNHGWNGDAQGAPGPAATTTTSTTTAGQGGGAAGQGHQSHQGIGSPSGPQPAVPTTSHQGVGTPPGSGGDRSGHATEGAQPSHTSHQATGLTTATTTPAPPIQPTSPSSTVTTPPVAPSTISPTAPKTPVAPNHGGSSSNTGSNLTSDIGSLVTATHVATPAPVTNGLGAALGLTPARALSAAAATPLLTAAAGTATAGNHDSAARAGHSTGHGTNSSGSSLTAPVGQVITDIERVVPGWVWLALALSLALATVGASAAFVATRRVKRQAGQFAAVTAAALTDPLTGVLNRRGFIEALERELARARRYNLRFVLAYIDVRNLKGVNDTEGHLAGDELLKDAAHLLKDSARADDVVGRLGGDEMGLLLVEQGAEGADVVINRITSQIPERQEALGLRAPWDLTVGTSSFPDDGSTATELLATADRRLYEQRGIALH